ncbi:uncharacterized mitochondrial protein AtMg00810-like [Rutidosis leptorrhynchoides]|uniref:uncharacterized mitochondrial protein AtMg00810-like n=1 Tax=Rutidosis leptorrhynchoides TaxID=125765 RepID=UPI003A9A0C6C
MTEEYNALINNSTWTLALRPSNTNIVRSMWLFKHKYNADGTLNSQQVGIDCDETFSPVDKPATIRTVLSLAISRYWPVHQLDVKNIFLHGNLSETIYMHQPPGFRDPSHPDHCLSNRHGTYTAYLLLYVDDIILTASSTTFLQRVISSLHKEFSMTDLGPLNYFLGISVTRTSSERADMLGCHPYRTPVETSAKLTASGPTVSDHTLYRSLAGAPQYLTFTGHDISYAVQQVCLFMHDPREAHLSALKRILRYIQGTLILGLQLLASPTTSLVAYSDAGWAGCHSTRRSTSRYCVFLGNNLLSWSSKRQHIPSRSSAETEYRGVANAVAETCWLRNLLRELHSPLFSATIVYCDNVSAVYMSGNPVSIREQSTLR